MTLTPDEPEGVGVTESAEFVRGWRAALHAMIAHCEGIREDRRLNPPVFRDGRRKFSADEIVMFERSTASSCKTRAKVLLDRYVDESSEL